MKFFYFTKKILTTLKKNQNQSFLQKKSNLFFDYKVYNPLHQLLARLFKHGLRVKIFNAITISLNLFFSLNLGLTKIENSSLKEFVFLIKFNQNILNVNFLLNWVLKILEPLFLVKCIRISKKYKKHFQTLYQFKYVYIKPKLRKKTALQLFSNTNFGKNTKINHYFKVILVELVFNYKNSEMYKTKLLQYKKLISFS